MTLPDLQTVLKGAQDRIWQPPVDSLDSDSLVVKMKNITEKCFEPEAGKKSDPRVSKIPFFISLLVRYIRVSLS